MKKIPVMWLHGSLSFQKHVESTSVNTSMEKTKDKTIYLIDETGIKKNHPQLDVYQHLASRYELWVDAGPRDTDDIVDLVFSGVNRVVLRPWLWQEEGIDAVRTMTDLQLLQLQEVSVENRQSLERSVSLIDTYDGVVVYILGDWKKRRFINEEMVKSIAHHDESYIYEPEGANQLIWEQYGFTGLLFDSDYRDEVLR
jgi:uncharacterized protein related to proFAR isomerase